MIAVATIDFGRNLFYRDTVTLRFSYTIPASPPRAESLSRVNAAFASFPAVHRGRRRSQRGRARRCRPATRSSSSGRRWSGPSGDGIAIYSEPQADPEDVLRRRASSATTTAARSPRRSTSIRAPSGCGPGRATSSGPSSSSEQVGDGVPVLEDLHRPRLAPLRRHRGHRVEHAVPLRLRRLVRTGRTDVIEIGDELDQIVILHELSHRWFNDQMFSHPVDQRGPGRGARRPGDGRAGRRRRRRRRCRPTPHPGHQPLNTWSDPELQSAASRGAGGLRLRRVVLGRARGRRGPGGGRHARRAPRRRRRPHRRTGLTRDPSARSRLGRAGATSSTWSRRSAAADEASSGSRPWSWTRPARTTSPTGQRPASATPTWRRPGGWAPPLIVRRAMASWRFDEATQLIERSEVVLDRRAQLARRARALGLEEPRTLEGCLRGVPTATSPGSSRRPRRAGRGGRAGPGGRRPATAAPGPLAAIGGWFSSADDELDRGARRLRVAATLGRGPGGRDRGRRRRPTGRPPVARWPSAGSCWSSLGRRSVTVLLAARPAQPPGRSRRRPPVRLGWAAPPPSILASWVAPDWALVLAAVVALVALDRAGRAATRAGRRPPRSASGRSRPDTLIEDLEAEAARAKATGSASTPARDVEDTYSAAAAAELLGRRIRYELLGEVLTARDVTVTERGARPSRSSRCAPAAAPPRCPRASARAWRATRPTTARSRSS